MVSKILTQDLGMKRVVAKFLPQLPLPEQKEHHAVVANDLIQIPPNEPDFLKKAITLKGTKVSLSYVQCFLYLISSSINVSCFVLHGWILSKQILCICSILNRRFLLAMCLLL